MTKAVACLMGAFCVVSAGVARAQCLEVPEALLWSYPADGDVEVPTNADLLMTGKLYGGPMVNGEVLRSVSTGVYDLGELAPNTTYEVTWNVAGIQFTTGAGPRQDVAPAVSSSVELTRNPEVATGCGLIERRGCLDSGGPTLVQFDAGPAPVAWLVDVLSCDGSHLQVVWPSECGQPILQSLEGVVCAALRASDGVHTGDSTGVVCSAPATFPRNMLQLSACVEPWPPEGLPTVVSEDGQAMSSSPASSPLVPSMLDAANDNPEQSGCAVANGRPEREGRARWLTWLAVPALFGLSLFRRQPQRQLRPKAAALT